MITRASLKRTVLGLVGAAAVTASIAAPAFAVDQVTQEITGGNFSASIANGSMNTISYSDAATSTSGQVTLAVIDARGTAAGWHVNLSSTDFDYVGGSSIGLDIPSAGFVVTAGAVSRVSGQAIIAGGPVAVLGGSLDSIRETIEAGVGTGSGTYNQLLPLALAIPAHSQTGLYTATLTVSILSAP